MSLYNPLQQLRDLDRTSPQFHQQLIHFLRGNEYRDVVPNLQSEDLAWLVEYLDSVLIGISNPASLSFQESLHELGKICGIKQVLPKSCILSGYPLDTRLLPASGCVYEGTFGGSKVRIQRMNVYLEGCLQKAKETFHQVAVVRKHLAHPNIIPLLGVTIDPLQLVSIWTSGGNLMEYITSNPDADRLRLLSDIAEGLEYLHSCNIIHGDLKGSNVLVDATGRARITDFGLAMVTHDLDLIRNASDEYGDHARWIAPEILEGRGTYSKEADVFSFAMVTIEVFTGAVPYSEKQPRLAMLAIMGGDRPPRPTHSTLTDGLWTLTQRCWDWEPHLRPNVLRISHSLCRGIPAWRRLIDRPLTADKRISLIMDIFSDRKEAEAIKRLQGDDAQSFVDVIDEMLDSLGPWLRGKCLTALCRLCSRQALLPRSVQIPLCYNRMDAPLYHGGFAEVWKGEHQGREVAVKVLKVYVTSNLVKITRRFCNEVVTWKALRHRNVLPLLGVTMSNNQFTMVSEWMVNGNINEFVKVHRDANRFELLKGVAQGLIYMHDQVMVHGDLKGANILIDKDGRARLADFGLLTIVSDSTDTTTTSSSKSTGTTRWMSPELLDPDKFGFKNSRPTKESDCYALGMVVLEVLTSQPPFPRYTGLVVMRKVIDGERPGRPQGAGAAWFTDDLWGTLEQCWSPQPKVRPTVETILDRLEQDSASWQPLPPGAEDDIQTDSDDESILTSPASSNDSEGSSNAGGTQQVINDNTGNAPETRRTTPQLEERPKSQPHLVAIPGVPQPQQQKLFGPRSLPPRPLPTPPQYVPTSMTPPIPPIKPLNLRLKNRTDALNEDSQPPAEEMLEHLGDFSPVNVSDEPEIEANSNRTLPMPAEATQPLSPERRKHKKSIRTVANEYKPKLDRTSSPTAANNANVMRKRSTKLWGNKVEEVTADQVGDASTLVESPSESKPNFKWVRGELISESVYGKVYIALNATTGEMIAAKQVEIPRTERDRSDSRRVTIVEALKLESNIMKDLDHPNIVQYLGFEETPRYLTVFLEYVPGGSIASILKKHGRLDESVTKSFTSQILDGLDYLHSKGVIHRDLKAENILVEVFGLCKISDFGISKKTDDASVMGAHTTMQGSVFWMAPEVINNQNKGYNCKVDIWSIGCVVFEMWTGERPWTGHEAVAVLIRLYQSKLGPPLPEGFVLSPQADDLRNRCFAVDPDERPTAGELRHHQYLMLPPGWEFTGFS